MSAGKDDDDYFDEDSEMFRDFVPDQIIKDKPVAKDKLNNPDMPQLGRAPTVTIETFTVGKPMKVLCLLLMVLSILLFAISILSISWMRTNGSRMGLFQECLYKETEESDDGCYVNECVSWNFWILGIVAVSATGLTILDFVLLTIGMLITTPKHKTGLYTTVIIFNIVAAAAQIVVCVMYPILFIYWFDSEDAIYTPGHTHGGNVRIGYCLVADSVGVGLLLLGTLLLCIDYTGDEVFYREKVNREVVEELEE